MSRNFQIDITGSNNDSNIIVDSNYSAITESENSILEILNQLGEKDTMLQEISNNYVTFMLNKEEITVRNPDPELTLINYLRDTLHLTGTKVSCNQGFCGVCTVLVSYKDTNGMFHNVSMNSCLLKLVNCHGKAITTIEGIQTPTNVRNNTLHPIQEYFHELGALQCGYCTTGFEMRMYATFQDKATLPTFKNVEDQLSGNICRCTGFRPIIEAYKALLVAIVEGTSDVSKSHVLGDVMYSNEYDMLKQKWAIGESHGLSLYNLDNENINTTSDITIQTFLNGISHKNSVFESSVWENYKFYTPTTLGELDTLVYSLNANDVMFVNGLTSVTVPGYSNIMHSKKSLVNIHLIPELNVKTTPLDGDFVFGAGVSQYDVAKELNVSNNLKFENMSKMIEYMASATVRNLASWVGSVMMTMKSGFRGDWATMLAGAKARFTYAIYNITAGNKTVKSDETYSQLAADVAVANSVILVHSVKIPKPATNEVYSYQRVAKRMQNAQAYVNVAISATRSGTADNYIYSNMTVAVGAVTGNGVQILTPSGTFSKLNIDTLLNLLSSVNVSEEHVFIDKPSINNTLKDMVYGLVTKFILGEHDMKLNKISSHGYQEFNSGAIDAGGDDYPTLNKIRGVGASHPHKMILEGGLVEDSSNNSGNYKLQNRDQIEDIVPRGEQFTYVGMAKPQRDSFWKVQGKIKYSSEMNIDALHIEMIYATIPKGSVDYSLQGNRNLLAQYRNYPGVEAVLVYDDWFKSEFLQDPSNDTYQQEHLWNDRFGGKINLFNNVFYPGFTKYSNMGPNTHFSSAQVPGSLHSVFNENILHYGQTIGCVISNNLDTSRYVAEKISTNLQFTPDTENTVLSFLDGSFNFDPDNVLNDSNTLSRYYSKVFGNFEGLLSGYMHNVDDPSLAYLESIKDPSDTILTSYKGLPYVSRKLKNKSVYPSNYENEKKGPFFVNLSETSIELRNTLGCGIIPMADITGYDASVANNYMKTGDNYKSWYSTYDASFGEYAGQIYTDSQTSNPLEGIAFTFNYIDGKNIECFINSQDFFILSAIEQVRERLAPKYKVDYYDQSGNHIQSPISSQIDVRNLAGGGSFGSKFWMTVSKKVEIALLGILYLRKPVKYMEYWKFTENAWTGRPNYIDKYKLSVDRTDKSISLYINDFYIINNYTAHQCTLTSLLFTASFATAYNFNNYASRATLVKQNIGDTGYQRAIMEAESVGINQAILSRASALLQEPQYKIILKHLVQFDNNERLTHSDLTNEGVKNSTGYTRDAALSKEMVFKELEVALLKNLYNKNLLNLTTLDSSKIATLDTKAQITEAFDEFYLKAVTEFNSNPNNKFKKRGMSLVPQVYIMPQSFVGSYKVGLEFDYRCKKIIVTTAVKDQGTGSFQNSVDVIADYLKLDESLLSYENNTKLSNATSFVHCGSTGKVGICQASMNAARKMMEKILNKYRLNLAYAGDLYAISTFVDATMTPITPIDYPRWFSFPKILVDRGIQSGLDNLTTTSANIIRLDLDGVYSYDDSFNLDYTFYKNLGLPSSAQDPDNSENWRIDLRKFTGTQLIKIYNQFFTGNNWQGRLAQWNGTPSLGLGGNPGGTPNVETLKNVYPPDLHRELIVRTLEYEYSADFAIPSELAGSVGLPENKPVFTAGSNGYVWDIDYYKRLVDPNNANYISTITKQDMTNRWPFIVEYCSAACDERDAGSQTIPVAFGLGAFTRIDNIITGNLGGEILGKCVGGIKQNPSTPEINGGVAEDIFSGSVVGVFGTTLDTLSVEGHSYENSNTNVLSVDTASWGFNFHSSYVLGFNIVELDILTGEWVNKLSEIVANIDRSINPLVDIGQLEGAYMFGVGMWTSENSTNILADGTGKRLLEGHWFNKLPTSKVASENFNATLLNRNDAYRTAQAKIKAIGELGVAAGNSVPSSIRDAIRNWREHVNTTIGVSSPFANDSTTNYDACRYMDNLAFTYTDRIKEATRVSPEVLKNLV